MFNTAYETLPCRSYPMDGVSKALALALVGSGTGVQDIRSVQVAANVDAKDMYMRTAIVTDNVTNVGIFAHPVVIQTHRDNEYSTITDARDVTKVEYDGGYKITSVPEYNFIRARAILQAQWSLSFIGGMVSNPYHNFPMAIYANWISDSLTRRFNLDLEASVRVKALAAFMYLSMHQRKKEFEEFLLVDIAMKISRVTKVPTNIVSEVIDTPIYFSDVDDFCGALATRVNSSRIDDINPVVLYSIIKGSWFGKNAPEIAAVAVEHPPTFDALTYTAASVSSFQRTILGTIVKQELRDREALAFVEKVNGLILEKE